MQTSFSSFLFLAFFVCLSSCTRPGVPLVLKGPRLHHSRGLLDEQRTTAREFRLLNHFKLTFKNDRGLLQQRSDNGERQSGSEAALGILLAMAFAPWVFCCLILIRLKLRGEDEIESSPNELQLRDVELAPKRPKDLEALVIIHGPDGAIDIGTKINV